MEKNENISVDPLKIVWSRKWQLLLFTLIVTIATYTFGLSLPKTYQARATVLSLPPSLDSAEKSSEALSMNSYRDLAMTSGFLQSVIDKFKSENPNAPIILYPEILEEMITIESSTGASLINQTPSALITFKVSGNDPVIITKIANIVTNLLTEESRKLRANESAVIFKVTKFQYISTKEALGKLEQTLHKVRTNNNLDSARANLLSNQFNLQKFKTKLIKVKIELIGEESKFSTLMAQSKKYPNMAIEDLMNTQVNSKSFAAQNKFLINSILHLKKEIPQLENEVLKMELQEKQLERQLIGLEDSFLVISKRLAEARISVTKKTSDIRLISKAIEPQIPVGPDKLKIAFVAAALSFFIGFIVACSKEHLDNIR